jgi:hypothetical protein
MAAQHPDKRCQTQDEQRASCCVSVNTQPDESLAFWLPGKDWTRDVAVSHFASHISNDARGTGSMSRLCGSHLDFRLHLTGIHLDLQPRIATPYLRTIVMPMACYPAPIVMPCVRFPV